MTYPGQSGRILRASWTIFCFILISAYSAYLVTTFTVEPVEFSIEDFQQLVDMTDFETGVQQTSEGLITIIQNADREPLIGLWKKLLELNSTNPLTFSPDIDVHFKRILSERYALIDSTCIAVGTCYDYVTSTSSKIRIRPQKDPGKLNNEYIAIPRNVFYHDAIYDVLIEYLDKGILRHLEGKYFKKYPKNTSKSRDSRVNQEVNVVTLSRIRLPIYALLIEMF